MIKILHELDKRPVKYDGSWMGKNPNKAFLISLGAGPWKEKRRQAVQQSALDWLKRGKANDLCQLTTVLNLNCHWDTEKMPKVYPFAWQNNYLKNMILSLNRDHRTFSGVCKEWKNRSEWKTVLSELFRRCEAPADGAKVLWMFARDYLGVPAFPIDRWVKRTLESNNLPTNSWEMTDLCLKEGVNPNILNRKLFEGKNPDWSRA